MPSAARKIRRVRVGRKALTRSITPHTLAITENYVFVLARSVTDNFVLKIPTRAMLKLLGDPNWTIHTVKGGVMDIDPDTTNYVYTGQYPRFLQDLDDGPDTEDPDEEYEEDAALQSGEASDS